MSILFSTGIPKSKKVENDNRMIREFKTTVEKILLNVSKGEFPGDYVQNRGKKKVSL